MLVMKHVTTENRRNDTHDQQKGGSDVTDQCEDAYRVFLWDPDLPPRPCCEDVTCNCTNSTLLVPRSALQTLHKYCESARLNCFYQGGLSHDWLSFYQRGLSSDQSCRNEWNALNALVSRRPASPETTRSSREQTQLLIRSKLKEIMMSVDIDEVTSKFIRTRLERELTMDLYKYKSYIDQEMLVILGQMDAASQIFDHVYLGSEWNASNLEELKKNGIGYILNVTMEIDNFFPGMFEYKNVRVYDNEKADLLFHWEDTYRFINTVRERGSKVLVHCKMGISRSASTVIAYAMKAFNMSLSDALAAVKRNRTCIRPNTAFCTQLKTYEGILDASRQRHNALWRSKSETNLTPKNERHKSHLSILSKRLSSPISSHSSYELLPNNNNNEENNGERRPKSWSPDERTTALLFPTPCNGVFSSGESSSCKRSLSLTPSLWEETINKTPTENFPSSVLPLSHSLEFEAFNPLYLQKKTNVGGLMGDQLPSHLQLCSSVKKRITEFETTSVKCSSDSSVNMKEDETKSSAVSLITFDSSSAQGYSATDEVIEIPLSLTDELLPYDPLTVRIKSERLLAKNSTSVEAMDTSEAKTVSIPNESITYQSGIVKRQKQDFEEMGKAAAVQMTSSNSLTTLGSNLFTDDYHSLSRSKSLKEYNTSLNDKETPKLEDPFSDSLDKVFDKEECLKPPSERLVRYSPSRNSSWGSCDSAVVLVDRKEREIPSRQSSWGSCDTRVTFPSRNSSFTKFDFKRKDRGSLHFNRGVRTHAINRIGSFSGSEARVIEGALPSSFSSEQLNTHLSKNRVYLRTSLDKKNSPNSDTDDGPTLFRASIALPIGSVETKNETSDEPLPGTVKQTRRRLEKKMTSPPLSVKQKSFSRSLSSCSMELRFSERDVENSIVRSLSQKKENCAEDTGLVKKITRDLEKSSQNSEEKRSPNGGSEGCSPTSTTSPSTSTTSPHSPLEFDQFSSSQGVNCDNLEDAEEVSVKNLVGIYEKPVRRSYFQPSPPSRSRSKSRVRADSVGEKFKPPVVPPRKSSLDFYFKSPIRSCSQPPSNRNLPLSTVKPLPLSTVKPLPSHSSFANSSFRNLKSVFGYNRNSCV